MKRIESSLREWWPASRLIRSACDSGSAVRRDDDLHRLTALGKLDGLPGALEREAVRDDFAQRQGVEVRGHGFHRRNVGVSRLTANAEDADVARAHVAVRIHG